MKLAIVVGARPQFIKLAPLNHALKDFKKDIKSIIIHTGQHYDYNMSEIFFTELGIRKPDYHLGVGSGSHAQQTSKILKKTEDVLLKERPGCVIVFGDTNTTLAGALAGAKLHIPVAHVEAGLRSYNKEMPEEVNRILTDHCSSILFCPTKTAVQNLQKEGFTNITNKGNLIDKSYCPPFSFRKKPAVINVGDIMHDAMLLSMRVAEKKSKVLSKLGLQPQKYYLATVHRAGNTENIGRLKSIISALTKISKNITVVFPMHPRTKKFLQKFSISWPTLKNLRFIDPVSYFDMLILEKNAEKILTDSGGVQKEAYWLGVPCITLRNETEWVETVKSKRNVLAGTDAKLIIEKSKKIFPNRHSLTALGLYGTGDTAKKILSFLVNYVKN